VCRRRALGRRARDGKSATSSDALRDVASTTCPWSARARPSAVGCSGRRPFRNSGSPIRLSSIASVRDQRGLGHADQCSAFGDATGLHHRRQLGQMTLVQFHSNLLYYPPEKSSSSIARAASVFPTQNLWKRPCSPPIAHASGLSPISAEIVVGRLLKKVEGPLPDFLAPPRDLASCSGERDATDPSGNGAMSSAF